MLCNCSISIWLRQRLTCLRAVPVNIGRAKLLFCQKCSNIPCTSNTLLGGNVDAGHSNRIPDALVAMAGAALISGFLAPAMLPGAEINTPEQLAIFEFQSRLLMQSNQVLANAGTFTWLCALKRNEPICIDNYPLVLCICVLFVVELAQKEKLENYFSEGKLGCVAVNEL